MGEPLGDGVTRREAGRVICGGGGGGSSSASTSTSTETNNIDNRSVLDGNAQGVSVVGTGNSISLTDHGAVLAALTANSTNTDHLLATAEHLFTQQQDALDANVDLTGKLAATAQQAYADAANQASGNKQLILAAMAVVAIVAFVSLGKK